jgi:hypothetical protein
LASLTKEATCLKIWDIQEGTFKAPKNISRMDSNHNLESNLQQGVGGTGGLLSRSHDREGLQTVRESESDEDEVGITILWKSRRSMSIAIQYHLCLVLEPNYFSLLRFFHHCTASLF